MPLSYSLAPIYAHLIWSRDLFLALAFLFILLGFGYAILLNRHPRVLWAVRLIIFGGFYATLLAAALIR